MDQARKLNILKRFRIISILEGISFLVLLFMAMPLKYIFDLPGMVKYVGWAHGILFVLYIFILFPTSRKLRWTFRNTFFGLVASVLPFGPFLFDRIIKKEQTLIREKQ